MDYPALASEIIRSLRGKRSQTALSRRLGYRSNVAYTWEAGRRWPTAATTLFLARRIGIDLQAAFTRFYRTPPSWVGEVDLTRPAAVAMLLSDLRGNTPIRDVARRAGRSRFAVSRWLKGDAEPRLPDFLLMIEATSLRLLDFLAALTDPRRLPSIADDWRRLQVARRAAYDMPWSHVVLRALETESYRALPEHEPGWIARRFGFSEGEERKCIEMLSVTGQIRRRDGRWEPDRVFAVDTRQQEARNRALKSWWSRLAAERVVAGDEGLFSYNLFTVSETDLSRLRELHLAYFRELRAIADASEPAERVVLANVQLFPLEADG
jgi:transcriptional regulator with XRE-family HTH domain